MPSPADEPGKATSPQRPETEDPPLQPLIIEAPARNVSGQTGNEAGAVGGDSEEVHALDVGEGNVVKLDKLGPMIINSDGVSEVSCITCYVRSERSTGRIQEGRVDEVSLSNFTALSRTGETQERAQSEQI